ALRTDDARRPMAAAGERPGPAAAEPDRPVPLESLPDIASLGAESDFRAFMRPGVPPELRRQALRKLWRVKPLVGNPKRLVEYDEDYTDAARVTKGLKTLYRVGRGVLTDEEMAALDADRGQPPAAEDSDASATEGEGAAAAAATGGPTAPAADGESGATGDEAVRRPSAAAPDATG
ncbi:MAG TPA: DUF3306 domain-containing protein, partial [Geminicoccaceae bacterium]|nr:DUF3306 domain-containing protein [Geminicoccaceae bacterium]